MNIETFAAALGQVLVLGGFFFWLSQRSANAVEKILIDIAVVKNIIQDIKQDHDKLIVLETSISTCQRDIDHAFEKIRSFQ
jgi:hypothetical protein